MPQEYLTTPAFEDLSLPFRSCEADAAALVGRLDNAFHPATDHHSRIPILCKEFCVKSLSEKGALIALAMVTERRRRATSRSGAPGTECTVNVVPIECTVTVIADPQIRRLILR